MDLLLKRLPLANWELLARKRLGIVCAFVVAGMLVAGLWPFHAPKNQVTWSASGNGLHFGRHGTVLSSGRFTPTPEQGSAPCTIEIWLQPDDIEGTTLFAFYQPGRARQFSVGQSLSDLVLQVGTQPSGYETRTARFYVDDVFRRGRPIFITITSGGGKTSVYADGVLARTAAQFPLSRADLDGELVVANLPVVDNSWAGELLGLAFYRQELTPAQVRQHVATWTTAGGPVISPGEHPLAVYLFDEHAGRLIHNQIRSGINLYIPDHYTVLDEALLTPFWKEFYPTWSYLQDVLVNIGGFVPFGLLFCAYLSFARGFKRTALSTVLLGFGISLTIEVLQSHLPTRDSGTTDVITNTLGTVCGVCLYRSIPWRAIFALLSPET